MMHRFSRLLLAAGAAAALAAAALPATLGAVPVQAASSNLFASVTASGTLAHGNGVTGVTHLGTGQYEVTFSANVGSCAYVATTINAFSQALQVFTAGGHSSANGVFVETKNQGGGLTDGPFNLAVDCGQPGWSFAVAGHTANLVRATPGTTLTSLGPGRYHVKSGWKAVKCTGTSGPSWAPTHSVIAPTSASESFAPGINRLVISTQTPVWCFRYTSVSSTGSSFPRHTRR